MSFFFCYKKILRINSHQNLFMLQQQFNFNQMQTQSGPQSQMFNQPGMNQSEFVISSFKLRYRIINNLFFFLFFSESF